MVENQPCKDCTFRSIGCHSNCASYNDWKQRMAVQKMQPQKDEYLAYKCERNRMNRRQK